MKQKPLILTSLLLAAFVINVDTTIVNVALPTLVRELHASNAQLQWVVDAYNLLFAGSVLAAGSLSDRFGRKGMLLAGLAVFGLASVAGGLTANPGQLIVARAVMGVGSAMVFPSTLSLISNVFTQRGERARAIGLWGAITGAAIALGPIAGGWLLQLSGWRSIFFAMTPVAALAGLLVARSVPTSRDPHAPRIDRPGFVLSSATVALLVYTIIEAPGHGWGSARTLVSFAVVAVLASAFVTWERRTAAPMLDLSLFGNLRFTAASASVAISFFALSGFIFLVTQYFQFLKGYGPLSTGIRLLPVASFVAISSILGAKLAVRVGTKLVVAAGLLSMGAFYLWVTTTSVTTGYGTIAAQMVVLGTGMGLTSAPATEAIIGRRAEGEGRRRVSDQRRHPPPRRDARGGRDRQRLRVALRRPPDEPAARRAAGLDRPDRSRVRRRGAQRRARARPRASRPRRGPSPRRHHGVLPWLQHGQLPRRRRRHRRGADGARAAARPSPARHRGRDHRPRGPGPGCRRGPQLTTTPPRTP